MNTPTPTPRTDLLTAKHWGDGFAAKYLKPEMQAMERELTAVTEQRDKLAAGLEVAQQVGIQLGEQRDRLAEALKRIANNNVQDEPHTCYAYEFGRMEGIAKIALAAVKGGSDE